MWMWAFTDRLVFVGQRFDTGSPRNDVLHITASLYHGRGVVQRNTVYQPFLWRDMSVPLVCKEGLHSEADWSTAHNHQEPFPPTGMSGSPHNLNALTSSLQRCSGQMSILHVGKLSLAICFQWNQIHKLLNSAPACVQLNPMGNTSGSVWA